MGTTTYMALNSVDPSWGDRVELAVLLAPAAYMDHMGVGEFLPSNLFMDRIAAEDFQNIMFLIGGYDE
jgi:hypothetical protein